MKRLHVVVPILVLFFNLVSGQANAQGQGDSKVPANDATSACRELCGFGKGKPTGGSFGFDSANECLRNCFASSGVGEIGQSPSTCDPDLADDCCNVFAVPGRDPDCLSVGDCLTGSIQKLDCGQLGGFIASDPACGAPVEDRHFVGCIKDDVDRMICAQSLSLMDAAAKCPGGQACYSTAPDLLAATLRCSESCCPPPGLAVGPATGLERLSLPAAQTYFKGPNGPNFACDVLVDPAEDGFDCVVGPSTNTGRVLSVVPAEGNPTCARGVSMSVDYSASFGSPASCSFTCQMRTLDKSPCEDFCASNADCVADEFCEFLEGTCDRPGNVGQCLQKPPLCIQIYDPVCGCDGTTYGNDCIRQVSGVPLAHGGECPSP